MPTRARVAVLRTRPETVTEDVGRTMELAGVPRAPRPRGDHHPQGQHLLALPVPGRHTTPWQLEGVIRTLQATATAT